MERSWGVGGISAGQRKVDKRWRRWMRGEVWREAQERGQRGHCRTRRVVTAVPLAGLAAAGEDRAWGPAVTAGTRVSLVQPGETGPPSSRVSLAPLGLPSRAASHRGGCALWGSQPLSRPPWGTPGPQLVGRPWFSPPRSRSAALSLPLAALPLLPKIAWGRTSTLRAQPRSPV